MRVGVATRVIAAGVALAIMILAEGIAADIDHPSATSEWAYCTDFQTVANDWAIGIPLGSAFEISLVEEALRFRGEAARPESAPQIVLREELRPLMSGVFEVAALVKIEALGAVFALDVNDENDLYDWSLDVSMYEVSFGYEDKTLGTGSGWTLWQRLDPEMWSRDAALGEHVLRIVFEAEQARAYVDQLHVASFPLPDSVGRVVVRLSVGPLHPPEGNARSIGYTDVRAIRLCFGQN